MSERKTLSLGPSGRYVLGPLLGRGGMADVYQAHDRTLGRQVAVKLLRDRSPDPSDRARFVTEAQTLARLNHPNLVTILDAGISDERPFLVLELVVGCSLAAELRRQDRELAPERVASIGAQVAAALAHCHAAGVVHRDVKPGNILLAEDGRALLTDFGISRLLDGSAPHTKTGFTIGTASYLAPEQVYGDEVSAAVDLYALGLVLLEACTGRREYAGTPVEAAVARLHRSPRIPADLPSSLSSVLTALTRTDPELRPGGAETAAALAAAAPAIGTLVDRLTGVGVSTPADDGPPTGPLDVDTATHGPAAFTDSRAVVRAARHPAADPQPATPRRRHLPPLVAAGGWVAAAAAAVALALTWQDPAPSPATPTTEATSPSAKPPVAGTTPSARTEPAVALTPQVSATGSGSARVSAPRPARAKAATTHRRKIARPKGPTQAKPAKAGSKTGGKAGGKAGHTRGRGTRK
jgi:hypothetical protein